MALQCWRNVCRKTFVWKVYDVRVRGPRYVKGATASVCGGWPRNVSHTAQSYMSHIKNNIYVTYMLRVTYMSTSISKNICLYMCYVYVNISYEIGTFHICRNIWVIYDIYAIYIFTICSHVIIYDFCMWLVCRDICVIYVTCILHVCQLTCTHICSIYESNILTYMVTYM